MDCRYLPRADRSGPKVYRSRLLIPLVEPIPALTRCHAVCANIELNDMPVDSVPRGRAGLAFPARHLSKDCAVWRALTRKAQPIVANS